MDAIKH